jgi:hypothetical protein
MNVTANLPAPDRLRCDWSITVYQKGAGEADAQVGMHSRGFGKTGGRELTERLPQKRIPQLPG